MGEVLEEQVLNYSRTQSWKTNPSSKDTPLSKKKLGDKNKIGKMFPFLKYNLTIS